MKSIIKNNFLEVKYDEANAYIIVGKLIKARIIHNKGIKGIEEIINKYDNYVDLVVNL